MKMNMKKLFFTLLANVIFISIFAQVPQEINYQGIARNSSGALLSNQNIGIKLDLHQGSAGGAIVFSESHNKTTNAFGLFTLGIGSVNTSGFTGINWASGPYFLEVSMDPAGGTSYSSVGIQQFMSVPYALYAQTAGNASSTPTITINAPNTVTSSAGSYTINVPAATTYSAGIGIDITGGVISNTATAVTPTITSTGIAVVTPTTGNTFNVDVPVPVLSYTAGTNVLSLSQGTTVTTATLNGTGSSTINMVGAGLATVTPTTGSTFTVSVPNPTLSIGSGSISISNGNSVAIPSPSLSINSNSLTINGPGGNTVLLPTASTTSITQGANVTVSGSAPNYTVSAPAYSISLPGGNTVQITNGVSTSTAPISATNLTLTGPNNNILSAGGNTVGLNTYTAGTGIIISGTAPNYTLASPNQSLSITGNSLSISGANTVTIPTSTVNGLGTGIATVTTSINNFTVNVPAPTYTASNGVLGFGSNTIGISPTLSLTGTTLQSGPATNTVNLSSINNWSVTSGVIYPSTLTNSVGIGTSGPISGKLEISHSATAANPHLNFVSPSAVYGRVKYSNTGQTNYFSTEYLNDGSGINEAFSINQFNGTNSKPVLLINGQRMTYINALNYPLATFHVMTSTATANGGIASEGFAQAGQLNIVRNNNAGAGARTAAVLGDELGKINFAGYDGAGYGDGAKIYSKAVENVTGSNKGTELIFAAVPTGTNTNKDVFKINGANKLEVITSLLIPTNAGPGKVLTSDALGNATWQNTVTPVSPWIQGAGKVFLTNPSDWVGIGTTNPNNPFQVADFITFENNGSNTSLGFQTGLGISPNNYYNTFVGHNSGQAVGTGSASANSFLGYFSGKNNSNGNNNTFLGALSGNSNSNGSNNTYVGAYSGAASTTGGSNVFVGYNTGANNTGAINNTFIGANADLSSTTQYTNVTAIGYNTKANDNDLVVLGNNSNVAVGSTKAAVLPGATRYLSVVNNGPYSTASNTSIELQANSNGGSAPVGRIDFINGLTPTGIARIEAITGTGSTIQGALRFYTNNTGLTEAMRITQMGYVGIGTTTPGGQLELSLDQGRKPGTSAWTVTSDERLKNIQGVYTKGLSEILKLQPIVYYYKNVGERKFENDITKTLYAGFSAQEVQKVFPEAVSVDADGYLNFNIHAILIAYTNAVKELNAKAESQEKVINEQKKLIESLELDFDNRLKLLEQRLESKTQK